MMDSTFPPGKRHRLALVFGAVAIVAVALSTSSAFGDPPNVGVQATGQPSTYVPTGPSPAAIPLTMNQCAQYRFCGWQDGGFSGIFWNVGGSNSTWQYVGNGYNDLMSSLWNRRTNSSWINKDSPGKGDYACLGGANGGSPGWYYNNLKGNTWPQDGSSANKSISSFWIPNNEYNNCSGQPQLHFS